MGEPRPAAELGDGADAELIRAATSEAFESALTDWSAAHQRAVPWNQWQKKANTLAADEFPGFRDSFRGTATNWTKYVRDLWADIMKAFQGENWRDKCKEAEKGPPVPLEPPAVAAGAAGVGSIGAGAAAGAEAPAADPEDAQGEEAPPGDGTGSAGADLGASAEGPAAKKAPIHFVMSALPSDTPAVWEPFVGQDAMETMSLMGPEAEESEQELSERVATIAQRLIEQGHNEYEVSVSMRIEYRKAELVNEWMAETQDLGSHESIEEWSGRKLSEFQREEHTAEDLEVEFRALGSWGKIPYALLTKFLRQELEGGGSRSSQKGSERPPSTPERAGRTSAVSGADPAGTTHVVLEPGHQRMISRLRPRRRRAYFEATARFGLL